MTVRESRPLESLVGSRSKAGALLALHDGPGTLAEITARAEVSKSAIRAALRHLEQASVVCRERGRYRLTETGEVIAKAMADVAAPPTAASFADYAGQWIGVDEQDRLIAASADPKALVADLRQRGLVAKRLWRVPDAGRRFEGANVR